MDFRRRTFTQKSDENYNKRNIEENSNEKTESLLENAPYDSFFQKLTEKGQNLYNSGMSNLQKTALIILSGGQGTRLGSTSPKGLFPIDGDRIYDFHFNRVSHLEKKVKKKLIICIMTSKYTFQETYKYILEYNSRFCKSQNVNIKGNTTHDNIINPEMTDSFIFIEHKESCNALNFILFNQECVPCLSMDKIPLKEKEILDKSNSFDKLSNSTNGNGKNKIPLKETENIDKFNSSDKFLTSPNGNGGLIPAIFKTNLFNFLRSKNIEYLNIISVDNILNNLLDPLCLNLITDCDILSKAVEKKENESVGCFFKKNNSYLVQEYFENGNSKYANICHHYLQMKFIESVKNKEINIHLSKKKILKKDHEKLEEIKNEPLMCYKQEFFIFDYFKFSNSSKILLVERKDEFSPIKNLSGNDSVESAKKDFKKWKKNNK